MNDKEYWYSQKAVQFEIVKALRFKELQVIGKGISIRWLNAQHVNILNKIWSYWKFATREETNFYMSLDNYSKIPLMSFNMGTRSKQYKDWAEERTKFVTGMDFGLDLDCKEGSWTDAIDDNQKIRDLFDSFGVTYANWMSGSHGFHFIISYDSMPEKVKKLSYDQLINFYREMASEIAKGVPSIDMSIYMPTRVLKCPYTISKNGNLIFPLCPKSWTMLKNNEIDLKDYKKILEQFSIRNRGVFLNNKDQNNGMSVLIDFWDGWAE